MCLSTKVIIYSAFVVISQLIIRPHKIFLDFSCNFECAQRKNANDGREEIIFA